MAAKRKVLICLTRAEAPTDLRQLLAGAGYTVAEQPFDVADPAGHPLIVVEGCQHTEDALNACRQLRARLDDHVVPILFIFDDNRPESRRARCWRS